MPDVATGFIVDASIHVSRDADTYHRYTDAELIQQCLGGEDRAWATLLDRYGGLIYSIALNYHFSPDDAADVFQSVCLVMMRGMGKLQDPSKLGSWVATVTRRRCYRIWEERGDRRHVVSAQEDEEVDHVPDERLLPDQQIEVLERERLLHQAVSMLDGPCRQLVQALFFETETRSYEDIAGEMGLSVSTLGPKRGRCLRRIRKILGELNF